MRKNGLRDGGLFHAWMISGRPGKMPQARPGPGLRQAGQGVWAGGCRWMVLSMSLGGSQRSRRGRRGRSGRSGRRGRSVMRTPHAAVLATGSPSKDAAGAADEDHHGHIQARQARQTRACHGSQQWQVVSLYLCILQCCRPSGPALCFRPQDAIGARQGLVRCTFMQRGDD